MSSKKSEIDWDTVGEFLRAQCSGVEIAEMIGIHENTLYNRCKEDLGLEFVAFSQQKKSDGKVSLKKKQYDIAMQGDKTMLVWLGKQLLGQKDKNEIDQNVSGGLNIRFAEPEEYKRIYPTQDQGNIGDLDSD
jgi:hypothetical protein